MKTILVPSETVESFNKKVMAALQGRELGKIVSFSQSGRDLLVKFEKLGTSEIFYKIEPHNKEGFKAELYKEKIAMTHRPFRKEIEKKLHKILTQIGAQLS